MGDYRAVNRSDEVLQESNRIEFKSILNDKMEKEMVLQSNIMKMAN